MARSGKPKNARQKKEQLLSFAGSRRTLGQEVPNDLNKSALRYLQREEKKLLLLRRMRLNRRSEIEIKLAQVRLRIVEAGGQITANPKVVAKTQANLVGTVKKRATATAKANIVEDKEANDQLLKSFLPEFRKLVKPEDIVPYPIEPTASHIALNEAIAAAEASIQRRELKP